MNFILYGQVMSEFKHTFRIMKITLISLFACICTLFATEADSQNARVSIHVNGFTIQKVINEIEKQTDYLFVYDKNVVNVKRKVNVDAKEESVSEVLSKIFENTNVAYRVLGKNITLIVRQEKTSELVAQPQQKQKRISGIVVDANGQPIIGANVVEKGTTNGIITDVDGKFTLNASSSSVLQISYLGYLTQEISIGNKSDFTVKLYEDTQKLDEVVVVGFGSAKRRDLVGSVSKVKSDQIDKMPVTNVAESLQGMASGLMVMNKSGNPGSAPSIIVRGINSISLSSDPLWVIDGVAIQSGTTGAMTDGGVAPISAISMLNPNDIESIEVLKDASATAIYGSRASSGVILVTTKSNKNKLTGISMNYDGGVSYLPINQWDYFADSKTWWQIEDLAYKNAGLVTPTPQNIIAGNFYGDNPQMNREEAEATNTNMAKEMTRTALFHQISLTANKGFESGGMIFSANYRNEESVMRGNKFERFTTRYNVNFKPIKSIDMGLTSNLMYINSDGVTSSTSISKNGYGWGNLLAMCPWFKVYDSNSSTGYCATQSGYNPRIFSDPDLYVNNVKNYRTISNAYLLWTTPISGLSVRADAGIDLSIMKNSNWISAYLNKMQFQNQAYGLSRYQSRFTWDAYSTYDKTFGKNYMNFTIGVEANNFWSYYQYMNAADSQTKYPELRNPLTMKEMADYQDGESYLFGMFARGTYKFADKYIINASVRRDGISAFSSANRWANFYAIGAGWILSEEPFLKNIKSISLLKLRASYGTTGNTNVSNNMTILQWGLDSNGIFGNNTIPGATTVGPIGTSNLKWETTSNFDAGIDYGFFNNRINGSFAFYQQKVSDLILLAQLAPSTGYNTNAIYQNVGDLKNWGFELNISSINISNKSFTWKTDFNISTNHNKITRLTDREKLQGSVYGSLGNVGQLFIRKEGEALGTYWLANCAGVDAEKGIYVMEERDKDTWNKDGNTVSTGNLIPMNDNNILQNQMIQSGKTPNPTFYGGLTNTITYKKWDCIIQLNYAGGNWYPNEVLENSSRIASTSNSFNEYKNLIEESWTTPGDVKKFPQITAVYHYDNNGKPSTAGTGFGTRYGNTTRFLERADYVRLKNLQIGYTFPKSIIPEKFLRSFRIYAGINNLFTITNYGGFDPEVLSMYSMPTSRVINFGLSIKL